MDGKQEMYNLKAYIIIQTPSSPTDVEKSEKMYISVILRMKF